MYTLLSYEFGTESKADLYCLDILCRLNIPAKSLYELHYKKYSQLVAANKFSEQLYHRLKQIERYIE